MDKSHLRYANYIVPPIFLIVAAVYLAEQNYFQAVVFAIFAAATPWAVRKLNS
jgi:positive regulator of sigma E activity